MRFMPTIFLICTLTPSAMGQHLQQQRLPAPRPENNVQIEVSARLLNALASRPIDDVREVNDWVHDACSKGISHTRGKSWIQLIPDARHGSLDLVIRGITNASNKNYPVDADIVVFTTAQTTFEVRRRIVLFTDKISAYYPTASACVVPRYVGVCSLTNEQQTPATDLAREGFRREEYDAQVAGARHAKKKMTRELEEKTTPELVKVNEKLAEVSALFKRLDLRVHPWQWSSTSDRLQSRLTFETPSQPRILVPAPALSEQGAPADIALALHESAVNELAHIQLAGKTYTIVQLIERGEEVLGPLADESLRKQLKTIRGIIASVQGLGLVPSSMTFADREPFTLRANNDEVVFTLQLASFKLGSKTLPATRAQVRYAIEARVDGPVFERKEVSVRIDASDKSFPLRELESASKALEQQLVIAVPTRIALPSLPLPVEDAPDLTPIRPQARAGWLALGWQVK